MTFDFIPTESGLRIHDQIERTWTDIDAGEPVDPVPASTNDFRVPLDTAVRFEADQLGLDTVTGVYVRGQDWSLNATAPLSEVTSVPPGDHVLDLGLQGITIYIALDDVGLRVDSRGGTTTIELTEVTTVTVGVRSYHERPAATITTTADPADLARAVSTFGSAMKTTSPERAYPTLRGHPPELAIRNSFHIPDSVEAPDTGVKIVVAPELADVLTVAPLAYYLCATVETGTPPRIETAGQTFSLPESRMADAVLDDLRRCFLLDCVVRTEGIYPIPLRERRILEATIDLDAAYLYDLPLDERTATYLSMPDDILDFAFPWPLLTDLPPTPASVDLLPYLVYSLSGIRSPAAGTTADRPDEPRHAPDGAAGIVRSFNTDHVAEQLVSPDPAATAKQAWAGPGLPTGGMKPTHAGYLASLSADSPTDDFDVHVVCNEPEMRPEAVAAYETDRYHPGAPDFHHDLTVGELRDLLATNMDLLHFIGHVDASGLRCTDSHLDARTVTDSNVRAFILNGCASGRQGIALQEAGSVFGIVTTDVIENEPAIVAGRTIAQLLDHGFAPLNAVEIAHRVAGITRFSVVGDGSHRLCPCENAAAILFVDPDDVGPDAATVTVAFMPNADWTLGSTFGSIFTPSTSTLAGHHEFAVRRDILTDSVGTLNLPVIVDGALYWIDEHDPEDVWTLLRTGTLPEETV